jgi:hypothetical protein
MVIIAIATERWSTSKEFTIYLSNAATMTSLFLGIVAILYSFVSNDGMSRSLGSITTVASEVRDARHEIENFVGLTKEATAATSSNNALVLGASTTISSSIAALDDTLRALSGQNETLKGLVASLPSRIDQLETKVGDVAKAIGEKPQQPQGPISSIDISTRAIERFLARSTLNQNLLTYACVCALTMKKPLSIQTFCKAVEWDAPSAFQGFMNCMSAVQLCMRKAVDGQEKTYTISAVHPDLISGTRPYFMAYIQQHYSDDPDEHDKWLGRLANIDALFT